MARLCERPGCSTPASVLYGFEAAGAVVWLDAWSPDEPRRNLVGVLCRRHADALTPPRGWWLDDRRIAVPRLFEVPPVDPPPVDHDLDHVPVDDAPVPAEVEPSANAEHSASTSRRRVRRRPGDDTEELMFPFVEDHDPGLEPGEPQCAAGPDLITEPPGPEAPAPGAPPDDERPRPSEAAPPIAVPPRGRASPTTPLLSRAFGLRPSS